MSDEVDFPALRNAAKQAMTRAYAPYSKFAVGAAGITRAGDIVVGTNVENVSYGLGVCAEVSLVCGGVSHGTVNAPEPESLPDLVAVSVCDSDGNILTPCGRCRQVLLEFGGVDLLIDSAAGARTLGSLLPDAFGPSHLDAVR